MPVNLVYEYRESGDFRRFFRRLIRLLGVLLILTGGGASAVVILVTFGLVADFMEGQLTSIPNWEDKVVPYFVYAAGIMVVCLTLGHRLARGKRRLVLFLRRFGLVSATQTLTFALAKTIGASWRLVTLDDAQVAPLGVAKGVRWISSGAVVIAVLIVAAGALILRYGLYTIEGPGGEPIGGLLFILAVPGLLMLFFFLPMSLLIAVAIYWGGTLASIRRAERVKVLEILAMHMIAPITLLVARRTRGVLSPRLVVVRVDSALWQEVVCRFASLSSAVIIDISEPSENLLWEISTLGPEMRSRWILVGERDRVTKLTATATGQGALLNQQLLDLLDGEDILVYTIDGEGKKRFARALRTKLESLDLG